MGKDVNIEAPCARMVIQAHPPKPKVKIIRKKDGWFILKDGKETPYSRDALLAVLNKDD